MGLFDLFGREQRVKNNNMQREFSAQQTPIEERKQPLSVFTPTSFEEVEKIINQLKSGRAAMVCLNNLKPETQIRVLDMLSGAVYALDGGVLEMKDSTFVFSPNGVQVF
ncbi:MAG: cell division protein SepF [Clostridia bacterium]|nr:cell division protein SepF [Clostridia bacterium]